MMQWTAIITKFMPCNGLLILVNWSLHWCFHAKHSRDHWTLHDHRVCRYNSQLGSHAAGMAHYKPGTAKVSTGGRGWARNQKEKLRGLPTYSKGSHCSCLTLGVKKTTGVNVRQYLGAPFQVPLLSNPTNQQFTFIWIRGWFLILKEEFLPSPSRLNRKPWTDVT